MGKRNAVSQGKAEALEILERFGFEHVTRNYYSHGPLMVTVGTAGAWALSAAFSTGYKLLASSVDPRKLAHSLALRIPTAPAAQEAK